MRCSSTGIGLIGLLLLSACAPDAPADNETEEEAPEASEDAGPEPEETDESEPEEDEESEEPGAEDESGEDEESVEEMRLDFIEELGLGEPDSTLTYPAAGVSGGEVTLDVYPVEVQDQVMRLALVFYPEYEGDTLDYHELHDLPTSGQDWPNLELRPELIDRENFTKYEVIRPHRRPDSGGQHIQWGRELEEVDFPSGEPFVWWAFLPAPEDEIDVVDVELPQLDLPPSRDIEVIQ